MNCDNIEKVLFSDTGDLESVVNHLDNCPSCAERYSADLEMELALRQLALEPGTVDITDDLKATIYQPHRRLSRLSLIQKWVWIATSLVAAMVIAINLPSIIEWLQFGYNGLIAAMPALKIASATDVEKYANEVESSSYYSYIVMIVLVSVVGISTYLWREFKEMVS
ncbi:MAG: hypothetical protein GY839_07090 [candidate division Zixibacteria bacterium]|nr:hypothetical protein [candidate division Zixibacteria bacterium]